MSPSQPVDDRRRSFMRLMALVARRDYLRTVRRRGFIFATALLPIGMAGLLALSSMATPTFEPAPTTSLTVVNESTIELVVPAGAEVRVADRATATADLESGRLGEFYVIPARYLVDAQVQRLRTGGQAPGIDELQRWSGHEQALAATLRLSLLSDAGLPSEVVERVVQPLAVTDVGVGGTPGQPGPGPGLRLLLPYALTFLFVMSIFITSGYLLQSVTEEKENRVVEIVLSSVPPQPLMAGKILGLGAAGLTQVAIWLITALVALPILAERLPI
ncbi:MAG: ABC transporter permease, partial [Chloroflexi bacterium]|nr:ABC transporter permease [Chloroflexota bacterium]